MHISSRCSRIIAVALFCVTFLVGCKKDPFLELVGPDTITFPFEGGSREVSVSTNQDCIVLSSERWCKLKPSSDQSYAVTCEPNPNYVPRQATVTISAADMKVNLTVSQAARSGLFLSQTSFKLAYFPQSINVELFHDSDYEMIVPEADNGTFIVMIEQLGEDTEKVPASSTYRIRISGNDSDSPRTTSVLFKQKGGSSEVSLTIYQGIGKEFSEPFVVFVYSSNRVAPIEIEPESARWTLYWGDCLSSKSGEETWHNYSSPGPHDVTLTGGGITEFSVSVKGLELVDLTNFQ